MWFIGVEVEQETSAPPPKKNPGSAPECRHYTLNVRSRGKQSVLFSRESLCFTGRSRGKHQDSRKTKLTGFPRDLTLSVLLYF